MKRASALAMNIVVFGVLPFYLFVCAVQLSKESPWRDALIAAVNPSMQFLGLVQAWGVFAPIVPHSSDSLRAVVTFDDGTFCLWSAPEPQRFSLGARMHTEPFRKWVADNVLGTEGGDMLFPDACRYIAWETARAGAKPTSVSLLKKSVPIVAPNSLLPSEPSISALYFYRVQPGDLQ